MAAVSFCSIVFRSRAQKLERKKKRVFLVFDIFMYSIPSFCRSLLWATQEVVAAPSLLLYQGSAGLQQRITFFIVMSIHAVR